MAESDISLEPNPLLKFGQELRRFRNEKGLTIEQLADRMGYSPSMVGSVERASRAPRDDFARLCEEELGLEPGQLAGLLPPNRRATLFRTFLPWMDIERGARELLAWEPLVVPGLLQTKDYARAILAGRPGVQADQVDEAVEARVARRAIFERDDPPTLWAVLDEGILYRPVGSESVTREQLAHLVELATQNPRINIQILPYSAMSTPGLLGGFVIAATRDRPDAAFVDSPVQGRVWNQPAEVEILKLRYQMARSEALPQSVSLRRIRERLEQEWNWS